MVENGIITISGNISPKKFFALVKDLDIFLKKENIHHKGGKGNLDKVEKKLTLVFKMDEAVKVKNFLACKFLD